MIDIGPNLSNEQFKEDLDHIINNAISEQVTGLILTSTDWNTYQKNLQIIDQYQSKINIKTTYGLHPHSVAKDLPIFQYIHQELTNPNIVSIGEFGLDYFRMIGEKNKQINVMERFLDIATSYPHLSLFLHERGAFEDFYHLLKNTKGINKSVVHCFTGNTEQLKSYLDIGCYIGITGWISDHRRNQDVKEALKYMPLDKLMIETDCPYLTPFNMPKKQKRNEPAFLKYVAQSIAEIKNIPVFDVITQTTKNSVDFFSLPDYNKDIQNNQVKIK